MTWDEIRSVQKGRKQNPSLLKPVDLNIFLDLRYIIWSVRVISNLENMKE